MERIIARFSVALMVASISATYIIPSAYKARGYFDCGGEWLLLLLIMFVAYKFADRIV